ncbi:MAG TPA: hypothetical protein VK774_06355 [Solirubrobacteraceae bacterium]|nr:hypothetical protein [Solirubrobacteraceae bacterium]
MRLTLVAVLAAAAALVVANMIGVAVAEAPTTTTLRTVSVEGIGTQPIAQNADAATATGVYRQAMAAAVTDGQSKAEFLTGRVGASLGAAQTITEDGGGIECSTGGEEGWEPYQGEQPDFGSARSAGQVLSSTAAPPAATGAPSKESSSVRPTSTKRKKKHKRPVAKKATAAGCKLTAQVSLVYIMG